MQIPQSGFTVKTKILSDTLGCHMRPKYLGLCKTISVNIDFICCFNLKVKFVHLYIDPNGLFFSFSGRQCCAYFVARFLVKVEGWLFLTEQLARFDLLGIPLMILKINRAMKPTIKKLGNSNQLSNS